MSAKDIDALERQANAAADRLAKASPGESRKGALADLEAAQRACRAARRAAGESLIAETDRDVTVTMGVLEDLLHPLAKRLRKLEGKK